MRVLDSEKFSKTQQLAEGARDFCDKVSQLNDIVKTVVEAVDQQARLPRLPRHVIFSRVDRRGSAHPASPPPRSLESSLNPRTRASVPLRRRRRRQRAKSCARSVSAIRWRRRLRRGGETRRRLPSGRRERRAELDRLVAEHESLLKVKAEQDALIAKLSGSSA